MEIVAIDPGINFCGVASFKNKNLVYCKLINTKEFLGHTGVFLNSKDIKYYIELPQIYQQKLWIGNPNDLINLAVIVGRLQQILGAKETELISPHLWKGSVKKEIMLKRIRKLLTIKEKKLFLDLVLPKSKAHNVLDAIGLGLWAVRRL